MSSDVHAKWMNSRDARDLRRRREALLQPVLDRLDVVVGRALDRLDALGVGGARTTRRCVERGARVRAERRDFGDRRLVGERDEPRDLDAHARADQAELAEVLGAAARPFAA